MAGNTSDKAEAQGHTVSNQKNMKRHKTFQLITEIIGWIQIALSPTLLGLAIAFILYSVISNSFGIVIAIVVAFFGIVSGIILANNKFKNGGTMSFLSRIDATPDLEKWLQSEEKESNEKKDKS